MADASALLLDEFQGFGDSLNAMRELLTLPREELSVEDRDALVAYASTLDARRMLSVLYDSEVVERCLGTVGDLLDLTERTLVKLEHAPARVALQAIESATRGWVHKYGGFVTFDIDGRGAPYPVLFPETHMRAETCATFFLNLGELRSVVRQMVAVLGEIEPAVHAPSLE